MSTAFKPLVQGPQPKGPQSRGKGDAARDLKSQFKPLGLSGDHLPPAALAAAHLTHPHHGPSAHPNPPKAEEPPPKTSAAITRLIRDGDRITHIEVKCACGEVITLACAYSSSDAGNTP